MTPRAFLGFAMAAAAPAPAGAPHVACEALAGVDAAARAEGRPAPVRRPRGTIRGAMGFEARLPLERWTGRSLQLRSGGLRGRVPPAGDVAPEPFLGAERFGPRRAAVSDATSKPQEDGR